MCWSCQSCKLPMPLAGGCDRARLTSGMEVKKRENSDGCRNRARQHKADAPVVGQPGKVENKREAGRGKSGKKCADHDAALAYIGARRAVSAGRALLPF